MKCPHCTDITLVMADRSGIEIDYCPTCRGVWLDRGELDKIIERSATAVSLPPKPPAEARFTDRERYRDDDDDDDDRRRRRSASDDDRHSLFGRKPKRKRESFLGDLFEF